MKIDDATLARLTIDVNEAIDISPHNPFIRCKATVVMSMIVEIRRLRAIEAAARNLIDAPLREHLCIQFPELSEGLEALRQAIAKLDPKTRKEIEG